jgi:hypothetical protein
MSDDEEDSVPLTSEGPPVAPPVPTEVSDKDHGGPTTASHEDEDSEMSSLSSDDDAVSPEPGEN